MYEIFLFVVGVICGWIIHIWILSSIIKSISIARNGEISNIIHNKQEKSKNITEIYYEHIDGVCYLYNTDNTFICQGKNMQEAAKNFSKHTTNIGCYKDSENKENSFFIVNGVICTTIDSIELERKTH